MVFPLQFVNLKDVNTKWKSKCIKETVINFKRKILHYQYHKLTTNFPKNIAEVRYI